MKKATIILTITALLIALLPSCNKTESGKDKELANVNIVFNVDGMQTKAEAPVATNEGIKTLRIIILDWNEDGSYNIIRNEKRSYDQEILGTKTLKIYDVPTGIHSFYFIANEESLGMTYTDDVIKANLKLTDIGGVSKYKLRYTDKDNKYFPNDASNMLPLSGSTTIDVQKDMKEAININMVHDVVKVVVSFENLTADDMEIVQMKWGQFFSNSIYMFKEGAIDVPTDSEYKADIIENNPGIHLDAKGGKKQYEFYMYPSNPTIVNYISPFTLGLGVMYGEGTRYEYTPKTITHVEDGRQLVDISRNCLLNINVSIAIKSDIQISFEVTDWVNETIDVPSFN